MKQALNKHHILPSSRGGTNEPSNICHLPTNYHSAWHLMFQNMTVDEAIEMIRKIMQPHGYWTPMALKELRNRIKEKDG